MEDAEQNLSGTRDFFFSGKIHTPGQTSYGKEKPTQLQEEISVITSNLLSQKYFIFKIQDDKFWIWKHIHRRGED